MTKLCDMTVTTSKFHMSLQYTVNAGWFGGLLWTWLTHNSPVLPVVEPASLDCARASPSSRTRLAASRTNKSGKVAVH